MLARSIQSQLAELRGRKPEEAQSEALGNQKPFKGQLCSRAGRINWQIIHRGHQILCSRQCLGSGREAKADSPNVVGAK